MRKRRDREQIALRQSEIEQAHANEASAGDEVVKRAEELCSIPATSLAGLRAKARVAHMMSDDIAESIIEDLLAMDERSAVQS